MNIIELMQDILQSFPKLSDIVHIDYTDPDSESFGLSSIGDALVKTDILGGQERRHTFHFYAVYQSVNDYDRLANSGVLLELAMWLERKGTQRQALTAEIDGETLTGELTKITCSNGMLYEIPNANYIGNVVYQLQITAEYKIESEDF